MADIRKGSNLIRTMGESEGRLRKVERQMAVPRVAYSVIATEESLLSNGINAVVAPTVDSLSLVTSSRCLVNIYVEVEMRVSTGTARVHLSYDNDTQNATILQWSSPVPAVMATVPGSVFGTDRRNGQHYGGVLTFWNTTPGKHVWSLKHYNNTSGQTMTIKNRRMFAWVTPF